MRTVNINGHEVKLYDSIDELPIVNFQKYNKCLLIDCGLGSDIESVDSHIINIAKYINSNDKSLAISELQNLRQNLHMIISNVSPKHLAFAALVRSIDGQKQNDLSDENLQNILSNFNDVQYGFFTDLLAELKKKLSYELELYFPNEFSSSKEKEVYDKLRLKTLCRLSEIADGVDKSKEIEEIDTFLFHLHKPKCFNGKDSEEIKYDKQFESACFIISQKTGMKAKSMTVLEFYNTLANLQQQAEAEKKAYSKNSKKH